MTRQVAEDARRWRNDVRPSLRTPFMLTEEMQQDFYRDVVCDRRSSLRYWAIEARVSDDPVRWDPVGVGGLTDIAWENGIAEIALILSPQATGLGIGTRAVDAILDEAFGAMRLRTVFGESYICNPGVGFWQKLAERRGWHTTILPRRKWWQGRLWDSFVFTIADEGYNAEKHAR
jgi:RimJ/RimL family protein N-acetyltransferase